MALLERLVTGSEAEGYWTLQGQVITDNRASCVLLKKCGFREVGRRERYGHIEDFWHDVILFERRSHRAGGKDLPTRTCNPE